MPEFSRGFNFDAGSLGRNLATLDQDVHDFLRRDLEEHAAAGEAAMKINAPWRNRTGHARATLWSEPHSSDNKFSIRMGHGAEYGVYLENSNEGRFQIIMPTLLETARSFMRSLEHMFAQMETHAPIGTAISGKGVRQGTSQSAVDRTRPALNIRTERGRFADQGKGYSRAAVAAKRADAKKIARNAARRAAYAAKKIVGTATTKRTRKG